MKYWMRAAVVLMAMGVNLAVADELFPNGNPRALPKFSELPSGTTVGGYPLYTGARNWYLMMHRADTANLDVRIASASLVSPQDGDYFAEMTIAASITGSTEEGYYTGNLCSPNSSQLFMQNKGAGRNDNCLLVDPVSAKIGGAELPLLLVKVRNSQSSLRLYDLTFYFNLHKFGFPDTTIADWSASAVAADPRKKQTVDKVVAWAKQLQDGVNKAIAFSKPQDAFDGVPPIQTLLAAD